MESPPTLVEKGDEIVMGLVAAIGTNLDFVCETLKEELALVRYNSVSIHISHLIHDIQSEEWQTIPNAPEEVRIGRHMDAGNRLREILGRCDAMAHLAIAAGHQRRDAPIEGIVTKAGGYTYRFIALT